MTLDEFFNELARFKGQFHVCPNKTIRSTRQRDSSGQRCCPLNAICRARKLRGLKNSDITTMGRKLEFRDWFSTSQNIAVAADQPNSTPYRNGLRRRMLKVLGLKGV